MKTTFFPLLFIAMTCGFQNGIAELLIFPSGQTNTLSIPAGEVWKFDFVKIDSPFPYPPPEIQLVQGTSTDLIPISDFKILSGPMSLVFSGTNQFAIGYKKMNLPAVQTVVLRPGETNVVEVPNAKTMKVIEEPRSGGPLGTLKTTLRQGTNTFVFPGFFDDYSFDGPCSLELSVTNTATTAQVLVYTFNEDFVAFPQLGYLQAPAGNFEVVVERTTNLTNWFPVLSHNTTSDQRAYYRFRISK